MALITLRRIKGSMLTHDEVDDNFQHLNTDLIAVQGDVTIINGQLIPHYIRDGGDDVTGIGWRALALSGPSAFSNTALGTDAGGALTNGDNNLALGAQALASATTAQANTAVGDHALRYATGSSNIGLGQLAGSASVNFDQCILIGNATVVPPALTNAIVLGNAMTALGNNTAVIGNNFQVLAHVNGALRTTSYTVATLPSATTSGAGAMAFVTDANPQTSTINGQYTGGGSTKAPVYSDGTFWRYFSAALPLYLLDTALDQEGSIGLGRGALVNNLPADGVANSAFGANALTANTSGSENTAIGFKALATTSDGSENTAVGFGALELNLVDANTALGHAAAGHNTTGNGNVAVGAGAGNANTTEHGNTAIGTYALLANVGNDNTAVGRNAMSTTTTSNGNVAIGSYAGGVTPGFNCFGCILIGNSVKPSGSGQDGVIMIGQVNTVGLGANTTVIGHPATTRSKLYGTIESSLYTVATLPAASVAVGMHAFVTDASSSSGTVVGGGSGKVPVYSDGAAWKHIGGGGGTPSGTSMPGSPTAGQQFFRTDLGYECYYDGTRWLTKHEYPLKLGPDGGALNNLTVTNSNWWGAPIDQSQGGMWVTRAVFVTYVTTTSNGSNYWTLQLFSTDSADINAINIGSSFNTGADTVITRTLHSYLIGVAVNTAHRKLWLSGTKTASPGTLVADHTIYYRLIVT